MRQICIGILTLLIVCIPIRVFAESNDYSTTGQAGFYGVYEPETSSSSPSSDTTPNSATPNQTTPSSLSQQVNSDGFGILPSTGSDVGYMVSFIGFSIVLGVFGMLYQVRKRRKRNEKKDYVIQ